MATVAFDGDKKTITITTAPDASGTVEVDVQRDLYSEAKRQWITDSNLAKYVFPFRTIGGDPIGGGKKAGAYFFLRNDRGWRIVPYAANHEVVFSGNLYREDTSIPLFDLVPVGSYQIALRLETSSLTQIVDHETFATAVWEVDSTPYLGLSNMGGVVIDTRNKIDFVHEIEGESWSIEDDGSGFAEHVFRDSTGSVIRRFALYRKDGVRVRMSEFTADAVMKREKI